MLRCALGCLVTVMFASAATASQISDKYAALGGKTGILGASTSDEKATSDGGRFQTFAKGAIYWKAAIGSTAFELHGPLYDRWKALGGLTGAYGYPITDQMGTYDGAASVSRFQGGELILRGASGPITEVLTTDLQVDLPVPVNQSWKVGQTYNGGSHSGQYVYCYDLFSADGKSDGKPVLSSADARILVYEETHGSSKSAEANVVVQGLGRGRYASSLHVKIGSVKKYRPTGVIYIGAGQWDVKAGQQIAEVSDSGTGAGNYHLHYCITTAPDRQIYAPFDSVPVAFRNYEVSKDNKTWSAVALGVPLVGDYVRHKANPGGPAKVTPTVQVLNFGIVKGTLAPPPGIKLAQGEITLTAVAPWGEVLGSRKMLVLKGLNDSGPISFQFGELPDYRNVTLVASYSGATMPAGYNVSAPGERFDVAVNKVNDVALTFQAFKPEPIH